MIGYYDFADGTEGLVQFRLRRSHGFKEYDVRWVIDFFKIANGGGHQGAIGFRYPPAEIADIESFVDRLLNELEDDILRP